eukprot:TRINITY_DN1189_c0_g1_i2.p1 TRINITY_DN1189_c0_g1~~TRINITY_DN1189_c0_g1_i2.p1  ORF type:complete len:520 (-),score=91.08 TRINITY_DN1189_c0_g1_i2:313-1872(-)
MLDNCNLRSHLGDETSMPTCAVCMEIVGTYGGPVSLPCGHNGCLQCLQELQNHLTTPLCPLCRTPFDPKVSFRPNFDLKDALEKIKVTASSLGNVISGPKSVNKASLQCSDGLESLEEKEPWIQVSHSQKEKTEGQASSQQRQLSEAQSELHETTSQLSSEEFIQNDESGYYLGADMPSAPPLMQSQEFDHLFFQRILEAEPPQWIPDSAASCCLQCRAPFKPVVRGRHHCRFCGGIFCGTCSSGKCLLPIKFREREPQRVCDVCYEKLEPLQRFLVKHISNASQIAKHDVLDWTCMRAWLNCPLGLSMDQEIYKASNVLRSYSQIARVQLESSIPLSVLEGAKGLAVLTVAKAGIGLTYKFGTGIVVARKGDGSWSAPSAIASFGLGWGAQMGGELTDFVIVLRNLKAVKAFCSRVHFSFGGGLSIAAGPLGRALEADYRAGDEGNASCYTYSCSKGAFIGLSLEGNIVTSRMNTNMQFYGDPYLTPVDILLGLVERPRAAAPLYSALHDLFNGLHRF